MVSAESVRHGFGSPGGTGCARRAERQAPLAWAVAAGGWRTVFMVSAGVVVLSATAIAVLVRNAPPEVEPDGGDNRDVGRGSVRKYSRTGVSGPLLRSISPSPARCSHSRVCGSAPIFSMHWASLVRERGPQSLCRRWEVWSDTSPAAGCSITGAGAGPSRWAWGRFWRHRRS